MCRGSPKSDVCASVVRRLSSVRTQSFYLFGNFEKIRSKRDKIPDLSQFDIIILILRNRSSGTIYTEGPNVRHALDRTVFGQ